MTVIFFHAYFLLPWHEQSEVIYLERQGQISGKELTRFMPSQDLSILGIPVSV
jgi:hypothetical protein